MAKAEKNLGRKLVEAGEKLLNPPSDANELLALLDKSEALLSKVDQSPSESISDALLPVMKALISKEILGHTDAEVRLATAACFSEITRITAPEAPYNDDVMKEIFRLIVHAFENLDEISSPSYSKRVNILETSAKVRSCVMMLDIECEGLFLDMLRHFLRTIRDDHPENVSSAMEVILSLVLEESEDMSSDILSLFLNSLKNDSQDTSPAARKLVEKVVGNSSLKLKSCLVNAAKSLGAPLSDYSAVISNVSQETPVTDEEKKLDASMECLVDDSRISERTVSDELAQESVKMDAEVSYPEIVAVHDKSSNTETSNENLKSDNDASLTDKKNVGNESVVVEKEHQTMELEQESVKIEAEVSYPAAVTLHVKSSTAETSYENLKSENEVSLTDKKNVGNESMVVEEERQTRELEEADEKESHKNMEVGDNDEPAVPLKKRGRNSRVDVGEDTPITVLVSKMKKQKDKAFDHDKGMSSETKATSKADVSQKGEECVQTKSGKKRGREKESTIPLSELKYDDSLVGRKVKVWWPDDAKYYPGVIVAYSPTTKKHKVLYTDGDKETLLLKKERFEFLEGPKKEDNSSTPEGTSKTPEKKEAEVAANKGSSSLKPGRKLREGGTSQSLSKSGKKVGSSSGNSSKEVKSADKESSEPDKATESDRSQSSSKRLKKGGVRYGELPQENLDNASVTTKKLPEEVKSRNFARSAKKESSESRTLSTSGKKGSSMPDKSPKENNDGVSENRRKVKSTSQDLPVESKSHRSVKSARKESSDSRSLSKSAKKGSPVSEKPPKENSDIEAKPSQIDDSNSELPEEVNSNKFQKSVKESPASAKSSEENFDSAAKAGKKSSSDSEKLPEEVKSPDSAKSNKKGSESRGLPESGKTSRSKSEKFPEKNPDASSRTGKRGRTEKFPEKKIDSVSKNGKKFPDEVKSHNSEKSGKKSNSKTEKVGVETNSQSLSKSGKKGSPDSRELPSAEVRVASVGEDDRQEKKKRRKIATD